jgi:hypothetical protein
MAYCPNCKIEYRKGYDKCADCGEPLVEELHIKHFSQDKDFVLVFTGTMRYEAEMIKANLEGGDVETHIISQKDHNFPGAGGMSIIKVYVRKEHAAEAAQYVQSLRDEGKLESEVENGEE